MRKIFPGKYTRPQATKVAPIPVPMTRAPAKAATPVEPQDFTTHWANAARIMFG